MLLPLGYAQANFIHTGTAAPTGAECTLGVDVSETEDDEATIADLIGEAWGDYILPQLASQLTYSQLRLKFGPYDTGPVVERSYDVDGGDSSGGTSPNVAYLVRKLTAGGGRAGKGRLYVPGANESDVDQSGTFNSTAAADLQTAFNSFRSQLLASALTPVVLHSTDTVWPSPTPITSFQVDGKVATQRRRNRR